MLTLLGRKSFTEDLLKNRPLRLRRGGYIESINLKPNIKTNADMKECAVRVNKKIPPILHRGYFDNKFYLLISCAGFLLVKIAQESTAIRTITTHQPILPKGVKSLW